MYINWCYTKENNRDDVVGNIPASLSLEVASLFLGILFHTRAKNNPARFSRPARSKALPAPEHRTKVVLRCNYLSYRNCASYIPLFESHSSSFFQSQSAILILSLYTVNRSITFDL